MEGDVVTTPNCFVAFELSDTDHNLHYSLF